MAAALLTKSRSAYFRLLSSSLPLLQTKLHSPPLPLSVPLLHFSTSAPQSSNINADRVIQELLAEVEREKQRDKEQKKRAGVLDGGENEEEEDYLGVTPLIEKLEKRMAKEKDLAEQFWEPTDTESDEDDERYSQEELKRRKDEFGRKCKRHGELLRSFAESETLDEAHKWMTRINKFEDRHLKLPLEYRVIGDLMSRLKDSTGKDRFVLLQKLNRAVRMMEIKEAYDPNNPANFGIIKHQQVGSPEDIVDNTAFEKQKQMIQGDGDDDDEDFNEAKGKDDMLMEKLNAIEKKIEEKLTLLDHTFGKKGRVLEEEIKELVEERNSLSERKSRPLYRKGFDVKVINVNRTTKVTKGGQLVKYTALLATGNYNGVVGFAKAKAPTAKIAIQRAYEKCFQNLHYMERYEEHTIAHAIQAKYEKTKIYLWPAPLRTSMKAGQTVETVLYLAGFSNVKSKIVGSRNPLNVVKALFKALNAIETPKDVQEKFGRTVVESYLMQ
ncbi:hypothetical protein LUZ60_008753 [Juncus effusus]|nr:hypothetical protein LUZ60_008753 [Juncus effusus]